MSGQKLGTAALPVAIAIIMALAGCNTARADGTTAASPVNTGPAPTSITGAAAQPPTGVSSTDSQRYDPVWVDSVVNGDQVSIPESSIVTDKMVHFWVTLPSGKESFMAYNLDGVTYVRASICVPCRSTNFSLEKGILVCDTCATTFSAKTGQGVAGACKNYPKDAVTFKLSGHDLVFSTSDLAAAYASTLQPG